MSDRLEDFIRNNREEFDIHTPDDKLWKGIKPAKKYRIDREKFFRISYRIAAVLIIFVASYAFHEFRDTRKAVKLAENDREIYRKIPELKEAEYYYTNLVNKKMEELQPFFSRLPGLEEDVKYDLNELDSIYASLKNDLKDNIANDEVLEAMIQNYRLKIQILEDLLSEVKQEKSNTDDEKNKYNI
jgi:hypothetical protein